MGGAKPSQRAWDDYSQDTGSNSRLAYALDKAITEVPPPG